jgi:hypothetical protein
VLLLASQLVHQWELKLGNLLGMLLALLLEQM